MVVADRECVGTLATLLALLDAAAEVRAEAEGAGSGTRGVRDDWFLLCAVTAGRAEVKASGDFGAGDGGGAREAGGEEPFTADAVSFGAGVAGVSAAGDGPATGGGEPGAGVETASSAGSKLACRDF